MLMVSSAAVERNAIIGDDAGQSPLHMCTVAHQARISCTHSKQQSHAQTDRNSDRSKP